MSLRGRTIEKGVLQAREEENDQNRFRPELDRSLRTFRSARRAQRNQRELTFKDKLNKLGLKLNKCFRIGKLAQCEGAREDDEETGERMAYCQKCVDSGKVVQELAVTVVNHMYRQHLADVQVIGFGEDSKEKTSKLQALMSKANQIKVRSLKRNDPLTEVEETVLAQFDLINAILNRPSVPLLDDDNGQLPQQRQRNRPPIPQELLNMPAQSDDSMELDEVDPTSDSASDSDTVVSVSTTRSIRNAMGGL